MLAVSLIVALVGGMSFGTTYYVSTTGADTNPGSQALPWATLQKAADTMVAGDTTLVAAGTYVGVRVENMLGTSGAPITLKAQTAGTVTVIGTTSRIKHNRTFEIENYNGAINYVVIDGFVVDGNNTAGGIDARSVSTAMNSHITIQNCTVHNAKNGTSVSTGIFSAFTNDALIQNNTSYSNTEHGCYTNNSCDNGTVRCNVWYSNASIGHHMNGDKSQGGDGQMTGWLIERNTSYSNTNGYDGDGVSSSTWKNNLAYLNTSKGIQETQVDGTSNPASDRFLNNTLVVPVGGFFALNFAKGRSKVGGTNNVIENNILYHADIANTMRGGLDYVSGWMSTLTSDYNVMNRAALDDVKTKFTLAQWQATYSKDLHSVPCTDPNVLFNNYAGNDFHLKAGSPAVDAGTTLADVTDDKDGLARTAPYDIGCYRF
jgi:hypothetical protein